MDMQRELNVETGRQGMQGANSHAPNVPGLWRPP